MSDAKFSVRQFRPEDQEIWATLWRDYNKNYESIARDLAAQESNWRAILQNDGRLYALALISETSHEAIGFAHYVFHHCTKSVRRECYLIDFYVAPDFRGQGGGQYMLEKLSDKCQEEGLYRLTWITKKDNASAQKLYNKVARGSDWMRYIVETGS